MSKINTGNPRTTSRSSTSRCAATSTWRCRRASARQALSFFGTSKRGYVYKFKCRISGDQAVQVFVSNPAIAKEKAAEAAPQQVAAASPQDAAVELVQAMYANRVVDGYEMRQRALKPVYVGEAQGPDDRRISRRTT